MTMKIRTYSEMVQLSSFESRYEYLRLTGQVGSTTFGFDRYLNQAFYTSPEWKRIRDVVIIRDEASDLGIADRGIFDKVFIHHMNPVTMKKLEDRDPSLFDPEFLICCSQATHNAIHYGDASLLVTLPKERTPGDTCPWL